MFFYVIGINFSCNDFLFSLNDVRLDIVYWVLLCIRNFVRCWGVSGKNIKFVFWWFLLFSEERKYWLDCYIDKGISIVVWVM